MKTYIVCSDTSYDLMVHIVNADSKEEALKIASNHEKDNGPAWPGCKVYELDTETRGVVFNA